MKHKEVALIYSYFYNNMCRLEDNVRQLQTNVRFRRIDVADCIELMMAIQELDTFKETMKNVLLLLDISFPDDV